MGTVIRKSLSYLIILLSVIYLVTRLKTDVTRDYGLYLIDGYSKVYTYSQLSDNSITCDRASISNIVYNMLKDDFVLQNVNYDVNTLSVILEKETDKYRLIYKNGKMTSLCTDFGKNPLPLLYINEDWENVDENEVSSDGAS